LARIAGVDLPLNKRAQIALTYIFGIGKSRSTKICQEANVSLDTKVKNLTEDETVRIRNIIQREGMVEGDLRKSVSMDIKRLMEIGCYRGLRHRRGHQCPDAQGSAPDCRQKVETTGLCPSCAWREENGGEAEENR
jgi:small subunit ribosomal protein S13